MAAGGADGLAPDAAVRFLVHLESWTASVDGAVDDYQPVNPLGAPASGNRLPVMQKLAAKWWVVNPPIWDRVRGRTRDWKGL